MSPEEIDMKNEAVDDMNNELAGSVVDDMNNELAGDLENEAVESVVDDSRRESDINVEVPDNLEELNANRDLSDKEHDIFISYSTKNSEIAFKICYVMEQNGLKCWIAPRNISSGKHYQGEVTNAINSTKIVVLVYSEFSQNSNYVKNEIKMAFDKGVPILSFNIDDTQPIGDMEYYLKAHQWLTAYPEPEDKFEKLIVDSYKLCHEKLDKPVIIDLKYFKQTDLSKQKRDIYSLILLFTPFYWASFIYMGLVAAKKLWTVMGFLYFIPSLMAFLIYFQIPDFLFLLYPIFKLYAVLFVIFWILAIIHGFLIKNEFRTLKSVLRMAKVDDELFYYLYEEYLQI